MIVPQLEFCRFRQVFGRFGFADVTAGRFSDLDRTIVRLVEERESGILDPEGKGDPNH